MRPLSCCHFPARPRPSRRHCRDGRDRRRAPRRRRTARRRRCRWSRAVGVLRCGRARSARACRDPRLSDFVYPRPALAQRDPQRRTASPVERSEDMSVCSFGADAEDATETIALVGDSHAEPLARRARRRRPGRAAGAGCRSRTRAARSPRPSATSRGRALQGLRRLEDAPSSPGSSSHPEIQTVFVGGLSGGSGVFPASGRGRFATSVSGYRRAWRALPSTRQRIVVIRDTPKMRIATAPASTAPSPRAGGRARPARCRAATVLDRDPLVVAASRMPASRVRTIDLTRFFCDRGPATR